MTAKLCARPGQWRWSSAAAHLAGEDDTLAQIAPMLARIPDWSTYLSEREITSEIETMQKHLRTGRALGEEGFIDHLEKILERVLRRLKPGPKSSED